MTVELGLCVTAIVASIIIGYVFKMNTGLVAACFAFVIGVVFQGASATDVIANWPTNLAYFILICGLFFNFAVQNGTIEALGGKMLYLINGRAALIPWIVFVIFIATKSYKAKKMQVDRPKDFEPVQKKTFRLLFTCSAVIVVCVDPGHAVSGVRDLPDPFGHWPAADRDDIRRNYCHADEGGARR